MKKFTLLLVLLLAVVGVKAKTAQKSLLWEGSNVGDSEIVIEKEKFSSVESGDIICIFFTFSTNGSLHVGYRTGDEDHDWDYTAFNAIPEWPNFSNNNTQYKEYSINATDAAKLKDYGLRIKGFESSIITKVSLLENSSETATSTSSIFSGSQTLGEWGNLELKGVSEKAILANSKIGDVIRVTINNASSTSITLKNSDWTEIVAANVEGETEDQYVNFQIMTAGHLDQIRNGIILTAGGTLTITAVDLLTYESSYDAVSITVGSDRVATYSNGGKNVQISACDALKAYYASAVAEGTVTLTELTGCIPASTGVMIYGAEGTYTVPVGGEGWPSITTNYLKATGDYSAGVAASTTGTYHYIFAKKNEGASSVGFYKLVGDSHTLAAHKAYLETTDDITPVATSRVALVFDDGETTGIQDLKNSSIEELNHSGNEALKAYYNLNGQRVTNPKRGLYIVNGKKVIIK